MTISDNQKKNASYINRLNKVEVLRLIRESGKISRADIVKQTKLSAPTVTRIVDALINENLVVMVGEGDSTGGRPPKLIKFDGTSRYVIGIDLGTTSIRGAISDLEGLFITEIETPTDLQGGFQKIIQQVGQLINKLIKRSKLKEETILGVGLAVAGLINHKTGIVAYSPNFNWKNVDIKKELKKHIELNIPVFYDNVSRVTALGELLYGIGKEHKNFICVNVGYGIGAGIIIQGNLFYGFNGFTGELGHLVLDSNSPYVGKDGIRGCLEALSSGYGIAEIAKTRISEGAKTQILQDIGNDLEKISAQVVINAAKAGDPLALEIFDFALHYLGIGVDTLIKLFDPEAIVFSGGLTKSGKVFFEKLQTNIFKHQLSLEENNLQVLPSSFKEDATLIGAFSLIISKILQFEEGLI